MINPATLLEKAKHSPFYLRVLNWSLARMIPFNKPHGFKIISISDHSLEAKIPYSKKNFNHIHGLHACALATISEFTTGFLLISRLDIKKYRIIMKRLEMDYHYQGKMDAIAQFSAPADWLHQNIITPLKDQDAIIVVCEIKIHDVQGNHLTTGKVYWQIKNWQNVKTKA
jgi:acyl-coenzyme A thioesterase PaaI-like protein